MRGERDVAGLRCGEVLECLDRYLEGGLEPELRGRLEAHVRGCDHCARFGGVYAATVAALRVRLGPTPEVPGDVAERLERTLQNLA